MHSGQKPPRYRFSLSIIGYAVWLYHRFPLSYRDIEELLLQRGIVVTRESIRAWCITFADQFAHGLRHREPRRGSRWHLDEMHVDIGGVTHWLWRAVDETGAVLDVYLQAHRDTEAATTFFKRLLAEHDVPEVIHTDKLGSYAAAKRTLCMLNETKHREVISTARCNNVIEQSHRSTRRQERQQRGFRSWIRAQGFLNLHARISNLQHPARSTQPATARRHHQLQAFVAWHEVIQSVT